MQASSSYSATVDPHGNGQRIHKNVTSYQTLKTKNIVMQQYDYSCGAAALATLFSFVFDDPVDELDLLNLARNLDTIDSTLLTQKGLSLLDLKTLAESRGYRSQGLRLQKKHLTELNQPALIYYEPRGYPHFAILKGVKGNRVYIADPARGNIRMSIEKFLDQWKGITLLIEKPVQHIVQNKAGSAVFSTTPERKYLSPNRFIINTP